MSVKDSGLALPNLRIEINNDFVEDMETDTLPVSKSKNSPDDIEDGELSDSRDIQDNVSTESESVREMGMEVLEQDKEKRYANKAGAFITGVDLFCKEEQTKLGERAKRFGLDSSKLNPLTEEELKKLYNSVGVKIEAEGNDKTFRLHSLHMRGTEEMSTEDIFSYFKAYGPASIEWINDYSCNVVWLDDLSAARALIGLSQQVKGLENLRKSAFPLVNTISVGEGSEDVVVVVPEDGSDSDEVEDEDMIDESKRDKPEVAMLSQDKSNDVEAHNHIVDASNIKIPVPPGKWRIGVSHPRAKNILLRFSTRADRKLRQAEKISQYYKKYGNPNYGGIKGLLTESRKRRFRRNEQPPNMRLDSLDNDLDNLAVSLSESNNPWGSLAKTWSKIDKVPEFSQTVSSESRDRSRSILDRIGTSIVRSRSKGSNSSGSNDEVEKSTRKVPRMRMYADEEEVKIQKRKAQQKIRAHKDKDEEQRSHRSDLRNKLRRDVQSQGMSRNYEDVSISISSAVRNIRDNRVQNEPRRQYHGHNIVSAMERKMRSESNSPDRDRRPSRPSLIAKRNKSPPSKRYEREKKHVPSPPKISSTVWSRLRHGQMQETFIKSYDDSVDRRRKNTPESDIPSEYDSDEEPIQRKKLQLEFVGDLRSKLNSRKTVQQKSPLRIEIDNDEYYRLIGSESGSE